jgi:hypothetical protein
VGDSMTRRVDQLEIARSFATRLTFRRRGEAACAVDVCHSGKGRRWTHWRISPRDLKAQLA